MRLLTMCAALLLVSFTAIAQESVDEAEAAEQAQTTEEPGDGIDQPVTMSGMSILGNEEAPKALVIIPWKTSELGDDISLSDTLDDRARPVDKEVFLRELSFYEIRSGADQPPGSEGESHANSGP